MSEPDRPRRSDRPGSSPSSEGSRSRARGGTPAPKRDGERNPYVTRSGEKKPFAKPDRDRKPFAKPDRDRKPYAKRDGEKRPFAKPDGDAKPYARRDGDKRPYEKRDGDVKPYAQGDGDAKPYARRDGDRKPYARRDGDIRPYGNRDVDRKPYAKRDGDKKPYGNRDGERKPYADREGQRKPYAAREGDRRPYARRHDDDRRSSRPPQDAERRVPAPEIPEEVTARDLNGPARNELKTLSKENADQVARHLAMAARLIDEDPALAHEHALAASRRAGRIAVVRETVAITAYALGDFALALRELRTYRRISGHDDQIALMVDSERGVGRPDRALEVGRSVDRAQLPVDLRVELAIAMSGARLDRGETERALQELDIPELDPDRAFPWSPALFAARATVLEDLGRDDEAEQWHRRAVIAAEALGAGDADREVIEVDEVEEEIDTDDDGFEAGTEDAGGDRALEDQPDSLSGDDLDAGDVPLGAGGDDLGADDDELGTDDGEGEHR